MSKSFLLESKLLSSDFTFMFGKERSNKGTNFSWHSKMVWSAWDVIRGNRDTQFNVSPIPCSLQIRILLPDKNVMDAFSDLTKTIHKRIISSMKEIKNLKEIRDTLHSKLISGEIRIPDAEKIIEEIEI